MSTLRFGEFELEEGRRELRLRGREIALQPRVFDLLCYLVRHRDRVVGKDELFEALWPGVIVTEGSLQRAVSLARSALREGGLDNSIRTHARSGYRFSYDGVESREVTAPAALRPYIQVARQAYESSEWESAVAAFERANGEQPLGDADLERWAAAVQCAGQFAQAIAPLEQAVAAHTTDGNDYGAARAMLGLAQILFEQRDYAVARGWQQRAARVLASGERCREQGQLMWLSSRFAAADGKLDAAQHYAEQALEIGREIGDPDIETLGLNYLGVALQSKGEIERGAALQDEAAAAVLAGDVSPLVGGLIYCGVIWSCRNRGDWARAAQWTDQFTRWCQSSPLHNFPGTCRLHRAEVLTIRGDLTEAETEAKAVCESLQAQAPWAEGNAYHVLGDIYLLRGEFDRAEAAFKRTHELGWDPQPGYALLCLERGDVAAAKQTLEHSLQAANWANQQRRALLLANLVIVDLAANDLGGAKVAMAELDARPELYGTEAHHGTVLRARAELAVHEGRIDAAAAHLREAIQAWQAVGSPLNVALLRLRLAQLLVAQGKHHSAELERLSAESAFRNMGAGGLLGRCEALKRQVTQ